MANFELSDKVMENFLVSGTPRLLSGGQNRSWLVGGIVLKPVNDEEEATYLAEVMDVIREEGFRVARPVRSEDNKWVSGGWTAHYFIEGEHKETGWEEVLAASRMFHRKLHLARRPDFIGRRDHRWERADQVAWGERKGVFDEHTQQIAEELLGEWRPVFEEEQLIHGDLANNVLLKEGLAPGIIDFTIFWRPVGYAEALMVVDACRWYDLGEEVLRLGEDRDSYYQMLVRALLFRVAGIAERNRLGLGGETSSIDMANIKRVWELTRKLYR